MSGFDENMTAFYMAFAEEKIDVICQALSNMRLALHSQTADPAADGVNSSDAEADVRQEMLQACEMKAASMQEKALAQLQQACNSGDDIDLLMISFLYCADLGVAQKAQTPFANCLARIFRTQARAGLENVSACKRNAVANESGYIDRHFYVEGVNTIMTGATDIMNAVADTTADPTVLLAVLQPIHTICAEIVLEIVHMYAIDARMAAWERRAIDQARRDPRQAAAVEADESLQMMDLFLDELSFIIRIIMSYSSFLKTICDGLEGERNSKFQVKIQEMNGVYLLLERCYLFQSVHKATEIAEAQELEPNVFVSSIVEDVSFVLNKAFFRASQCMNYHTALSVVIAIVDALDSMYLPAIQQLPSRPCVIPMPTLFPSSETTQKQAADDQQQDSNAVSFSDMLLQAVDDDLTRSIQEDAKLIMAINSSFMSGEFVERLEQQISDVAAASFPHETPFADCLPKPISELTDAFHSIVEHEIQDILLRGIGSKLEKLTRHHISERFEYVLTAAQYDASEVQGSPLIKLIEQEVMKNKVLRRYETALCSTPFESLVDYLVQDLTNWIVQAFLSSRKPFNDLGALQFEREVTEILVQVSQLVKQRSLRTAFTGLFQVVLILNLMRPQHVVDYLESVQQEFSPHEIETLLQMRVDFKREDITQAIAQVRQVIAAAK